MKVVRVVWLENSLVKVGIVGVELLVEVLLWKGRENFDRFLKRWCRMRMIPAIRERIVRAAMMVMRTIVPSERDGIFLRCSALGGLLMAASTLRSDIRRARRSNHV